MKGGFTMLELLLIIAIIGILAWAGVHGIRLHPNKGTIILLDNNE